ncbi:hypothetical protein O0L34_g5414 [Tuta absoluta]|nr:hypothetical protein O0L34_g5414 [Tuta absoluta]
MKRLSVFLVLAITLNVAVGMTFRHKRQSNGDDDENNLDDRYGERPGWNPPRRPNQGWQQQQRPRPNQGNQWNQGGNQWDQGNQGSNQWNQGGNQWDQGNQGGNQWDQGNQGNQPRPTPTPNANGSTTQSTSVETCIRNCPVTAEYNPVCGTNLVQYTNPGRLTCAQSCGVNVSLLRASPCPSTSTAAPAT